MTRLFAYFCAAVLCVVIIGTAIWLAQNFSHHRFTVDCSKDYKTIANQLPMNVIHTSRRNAYDLFTALCGEPT